MYTLETFCIVESMYAVVAPKKRSLIDLFVGYPWSMGFRIIERRCNMFLNDRQSFLGRPSGF